MFILVIDGVEDARKKPFFILFLILRDWWIVKARFQLMGKSQERSLE